MIQTNQDNGPNRANTNGTLSGNGSYDGTPPCTTDAYPNEKSGNQHWLLETPQSDYRNVLPIGIISVTA